MQITDNDGSERRVVCSFDPIQGAAGEPVRFVAATEGPAQRLIWYTTWLEMTGIDLTRFVRNPIVLMGHDSDKPVGLATVRIDGNRLMADVTFVDRPEGHDAADQVAKRMIRGMSVGYIPDMASRRIIGEGETWEMSSGTVVQGPAEIIQRWTLSEVSLVTQPANADALLQEMSVGGVWYTSNPVQQEQNHNQEIKPMENEPKETAKPDATATATMAVPVSPPDPLATERLRVERIRLLGGPGLEAAVQYCITDELSVEDARKHLCAELERMSAPAGVTEPEIPTKAATNAADTLSTVSDDALAAAFTGMRVNIG